MPTPSLALQPDWPRIFPDADFRLSMGLRPGDSAAFWRDWDGRGAISEQRRHWLSTASDLYAACLPEGGMALEEARAWMKNFSHQPEPDWVVLSGGGDADLRVLAGEVTFPSGWSLPEKLGMPISSVHGPVPGLQEQLGHGVQVFLSRLKAGDAWLRDNWGLAADAELNHHPARTLPKLTATACPETVWIRLEHQCLTRLPVSNCVLFGIRVSCHRLSEVAELPGMRERIHRALTTMPLPMAQYKGLSECQHHLLSH